MTERERQRAGQRERERETWDITKRDIERGSGGERSRERSTPAAIRFPSAEKLSVDTSRRFPFTLSSGDAEGEGVCFVLDCGFMLVRFSVHSQLGVFTPVRMTCVREGERKRDRAESETGRRARDRERSASKRKRRARERREKEQKARRREGQRV